MKRALAHVLVVMLNISGAAAQQDVGYQGTDFLVAFMPNDHSESSNPDLLLFITAARPTICTITATARDGAVAIQTITVGTSSRVATVRLPHTLYELVGIHAPQQQHDLERPSPCHVRIESTDTVAVYACSREFRTTDAWLVYPTSSLGTEHYVMSYESDLTNDPFRPTLRFPSQFVVVANEDETDVEILLSTPRSAVATGNVRTVRLQRGQSYLVQAHVVTGNVGADLTGTRIRSSKPVAVISGHYRASVPRLESTDSRDLLAEQVPSVDKWGTQFAVPQMVEPSNVRYVSQRDRPPLRVVAALDSTVVTVNDVRLPRLNAGQYATQALSSAAMVKSNHPILVAIIDRSTTITTDVVRNGDPSLILIPPIDQYLPSYRVISIEPNETNSPAMQAHWLIITYPQGALPELRVDGYPVAATGVIPGTTMQFAHVPVSRGQHDIDCNQPIGVIAVGYGAAESYGYTAGQLFRRLREPSIRLRIMHDTAGIGESVNVAIVVDSVANPAELDELRVDRLQLQVRWDASVLVPSSQNEWRYSVQDQSTLSATSINSIKQPLVVGDTVGVIRGIAVMGLDSVTTISGVQAAWYADGTSVPLSTTIVDGSLTITGHCRSQSLRLFDPNGRSTPPIARLQGEEIEILRDVTCALWWVDVLGRRFMLTEGYLRHGDVLVRPTSTSCVGIIIQEGHRWHVLR